MDDDFCHEFLNEVYPIGSIYMSGDDIDPNKEFRGTWKIIQQRISIGNIAYYPAVWQRIA